MFANNERGYKRRKIMAFDRYFYLFIRRQLIKRTYTEERSDHTNSESYSDRKKMRRKIINDYGLLYLNDLFEILLIFVNILCSHAFSIIIGLFSGDVFV